MAKKKATPAAEQANAEAEAPPDSPDATPKTAAGSAPALKSVRVRMYRQGLGDCFLLSFPTTKPGADAYHVLIDCGVILGTPKADELLKAVVDDISETTKDHLDLLVVTHEHWDHVAAFDPAKDWFKGVTIDKVWLAWTEDPDNETAQSLRRQRAQNVAALWVGFGPLRDHVNNLLERAPALAAGGADDAEREQLQATLASIDSTAQVLSFFGIDPALDTPPAEGGALGAAAAAVSKTGAAMKWARTVTQNPTFCKPGDVISLPDAGGVRAFVLGPPTDLPQLLKDMPTRAGHETYDELKAQSQAAARAFFAAAGAQGPQPGFDASVPFDRKYGISRDYARTTDFFRDHYFGTGAKDDDAWRRIEGDWTAGAAGFALQLDSDTNNTSLALAFELPDGRVLLFPGDAQVGNWESWHADPDGKPRVWKVDAREVTAEHLLNRTVLYKVGHHGSHNATLREKGLEMMTDPDLAAMVPVDVYIAHVKKRWTKMPFDPLMSRLSEVTHGRVLQADQAVAPAAGGTPPAPAPWPNNATTFPTLVSDSVKRIDVVIDDQGTTASRPLYVDYLL